MNPQILGISMNFSALLLQLRSLSVYPLEIIPGTPPVPWRSDGDPMPWRSHGDPMVLGRLCVPLGLFEARELLRATSTWATGIGMTRYDEPQFIHFAFDRKMRGYKSALVGYKVM